MANRDYYQVLGVTRGAADYDIKNAFRELAKLYHPDRNPGNAEAERRFKEINEAYDALKDPNKRAIYNHHLDFEVDARPRDEPEDGLWRAFVVILFLILALGGASAVYYAFRISHKAQVEKSAGGDAGKKDAEPVKKGQDQLVSSPGPGRAKGAGKGPAQAEGAARPAAAPAAQPPEAAAQASVQASAPAAGEGAPAAEATAPASGEPLAPKAAGPESAGQEGATPAQAPAPEAQPSAAPAAPTPQEPAPPAAAGQPPAQPSAPAVEERASPSPLSRTEPGAPAAPPSPPAPDSAAAWEKVRDSDDLLLLDAFIGQHENSAEALQARSRLQRLVTASEDVNALETLVRQSQSRPGADVETPDLARNRIALLEERRREDARDDAAWSVAQARGGAEPLLTYLKERPKGKRADVVRERLASLGLIEVRIGSKDGEPPSGEEEAEASAEAERRGWFTAGDGQSFKDCPKCPEMVVAAAGACKMGSPDSEEGRGQSEGPRHEVRLAKPFAIGRFEVSFDDWDACVAAGGCHGYRPESQGPERGLRPVINVSWEDAQEYVGWLSRRTGKSYRLPTEAEWEYAARAGSDTAYWWGAHVSPGKANYAGERGERPAGLAARVASVKAFAPNRWGLHQVAGNVWEWVEDCWHENYRGAPADGRAWGEEGGGDCQQRVLRGGSWMSGPAGVRSAHRGRVSLSLRDIIYGFRVARDL